MQLLHDNLLVKEAMKDTTIGGTSLHYKYDDDDPFMEVEVIDVSVELSAEYAKYYSSMNNLDLKFVISNIYSVGSHLLIRRINKLPYKDGLFFISFKDVIAVLNKEDKNLDKEDELNGRN